MAFMYNYKMVLIYSCDVFPTESVKETKNHEERLTKYTHSITQKPRQ